MKSIISEIFYGNRGYAESFKISEEYYKVLTELTEIFEELEKDLSDAKKQLLNKCCYLHGEMEMIASEQHFIEGVKIGIMLGIETYN